MRAAPGQVRERWTSFKKRKQASCKMPQDANNYPDVIHDLLTLTAPLHFGSRPGTEKLLSRDESLTRLAGEAKML